MRRLLRIVVIALALGAAMLAGARPASAHPMGNFSINHFSDLIVGRHMVRVLYIVDLAEIPTFQELGDLNATHSANLPPVQRAAYLASKARSLAGGLALTFDGRSLPLAVRASDLLFPPGAGGLPTERVYLVLEAPLPAGAGTLAYQDGNFPDRAGWKEIVAPDSARLARSSVPATSRSAALTVYPANATSSPPQDLAATLTTVTAAGSGAAAGVAMRDALLPPAALIRQAEAPLQGRGGAWSALARRLAVKGPSAQSVSWAQGRMDALSALIARRDLSPAVLALSLLIALVLGAFHAFSPGHGKTVVAAYIVGSRATAWHAVVLGLTVTATHTAGVFALGLVTLGLSHYIVPDKLYPWLGAASGLGITVIGLTLALRRLAALRRPAHVHTHLHPHANEHEHEHEHEHDHDHDHAHWPAGRADGAGTAGNQYHSVEEEGHYVALGG